MAYVESHQSLRHHPKTRKLARRLDVSLPTAIGHLHCLWWWALDLAEDGDLEAFDAEDIAIAGEWEGDEQIFFEALIACGWIDADPKQLHNWDQYTGRLQDIRRANRERQRLYRERKNEELSRVTNALRNSDKDERNALRNSESRVTNSLNKTKQNKTEQDLKDMSISDEPNSTPLRNGKPDVDTIEAENVQAVFDHYCMVWKPEFPRGPKLSADRRQKLKTRLRSFSVDELKAAISQAHDSEWLRGVNPSREVYGTIDYCIRSDGQITKFLEAKEAKADLGTGGAANADRLIEEAERELERRTGT